VGRVATFEESDGRASGSGEEEIEVRSWRWKVTVKASVPATMRREQARRNWERVIVLTESN